MTKTHTYDGLLFDALNPTIETVPSIEAIAHQLSCVNRFSGALERPYSVAEHSVRVSSLLQGPSPNALAGLLHDASEAFLGDVPTPHKRSPGWEAYRQAEERLQSLLMRVYGPARWDEGAVKWADEVMLHTEAWSLSTHRHRAEWIDQSKVMRGMALGWDWQMAKSEFLKTFGQLKSYRVTSSPSWGCGQWGSLGHDWLECPDCLQGFEAD